MNILCIATYVSLRVYKIMYTLHKKGHKIYLLYENIGVSAINQNQDFWVKKIKNPKLEIPGSNFLSLFFPRIHKNTIQKIVKQNKIELIHCYSAPDVFAVASARYAKIPVIYDVKEITTTFDKEGVMDLFFFPFLKRNKIIHGFIINFFWPIFVKLEKEANEKSLGRIYYSTEALKHISKKYNIDKKHSIVLHNYSLEKDISKNSLKKVSNNESNLNIVYEGAITSNGCRRNNFSLFKNIAQKKIDIYIYGICEDKNLAEELIGYSKENKYFHYMGNCNPNELIQELTKYDYGIIPNVCTNDNKLNEIMMPNKLFDYLSAGLPVLINKSNLKSLENFITNENVGLVYQDLDDLKTKVKSNKNKFEIWPYRYTMENNISIIESFYNSILDNYNKEQ